MSEVKAADDKAPTVKKAAAGAAADNLGTAEVNDTKFTQVGSQALNTQTALNEAANKQQMTNMEAGALLDRVNAEFFAGQDIRRTMAAGAENRYLTQTAGEETRSTIRTQGQEDRAQTALAGLEYRTGLETAGEQDRLLTKTTAEEALNSPCWHHRKCIENSV